MGNLNFDYKIIRRKGKGFRGQRKTLSVYVRNDANASVEVRCGLKTPIAVVEDFLMQKSAWINKTRAKVLAEREQTRNRFTFDTIQKLPLLGKLYPIDFVDTNHISFTDDRFIIPTYMKSDPEKFKLALKNLYKKIARDFLSELVTSTAHTMNVRPAGLRITSAHTRWGSCSAKNSLNFSYRLIFADPDCIRYVVVHELAHIRHHDHSAHFWSLVAAHAPDYRAQAARLKSLARSPWFREL